MHQQKNTSLFFYFSLGAIAVELFLLRFFRRLLAPRTHITFGKWAAGFAQVVDFKLPENIITHWFIKELQLCYWYYIAETADEAEKKQYNQVLNNFESRQRTEYVYSYPTRMSIEITRNCNLRCRMCPQDWLEVDKREISSQVIDAIKFLIPYQNYVAVFGFGESLTAPHFFEYLNRLSFHSQQTVALITNGVLMTPEVSQKIVESPISELLISIDTVDAETYRFIRQANLFPKIVENIEQFNRIKNNHKNQKPKLRLGFVAMRKNIEELPAFIRFAKKVNAADVDVGYLNVFSEELREQSLFYEPELANQIFHESQRLADELQIRLNIPELNEHPEKCCLEPWQFVYINSDGTITPCCINISILGDLTQTDFLAIWNNQRYQQLRRQMNTATEPYRCRYCFDCRYKNISNIEQHFIVVEPGPR